MTKTLAILTANVPNNHWLLTILQPLTSFRLRFVDDKPDMSFRDLSTADLIVLGPDVPRWRRMVALRALARIGVAAPALAVVPPNESVEQVLDYLRQGASAVILDTDSPGEFMRALELVSAGRLYLSAGLIPGVLKRYRELCAEMRRKLGSGLAPSNLRSRSG